MSEPIHNPSRLYVALDYDNARDADALVEKLPPVGCGLKVGKELFTAVGPEWVRRRVVDGYSVFLDLKFHDIPNTVAKACRVGAAMGVDILNVHAAGGEAMMTGAREAVRAENPATALIGVTVLTSMSDADLASIGVPASTAEQVARLGELARKAGLDGVVCSGQEAGGMRERFGPQGLLVTPGIRPTWAAADDQRRIMTPAEAMKAGASALVIGRPITAADEPDEAVRRILEELDGV